MHLLLPIISIVASFLLVLAMHLHNKDKIRQMQEDWITALRKQREEAYLDGYVNGIADEKLVWKNRRKFASSLTVKTNFEPATAVMPKIDDITKIIGAAQ